MRLLLVSMAAAGLGLIGCSKSEVHSGHNSALMSNSYPVVNTAGQKLGTVTILDTADGVDVNLDIQPIPAGEHAIHFHTTGACDGAGGFKSSGGHYNPKSVEHGHDGTTGPHAGDMKNFNAPQSGVVKITIKNDKVSLSDRHEFSPLLDSDGTALIIHAGADDYKSQPSGAAGARIACAVISK